ncbi:amino acid adenylation domain-containing protein [Kribbella deserti]|uniref:Amino acid adenylation domain-containing protein n=1 Tax=Kribbella deserti TaxID=1926257 RepID=A0ABV6QGJ7_9ACTN
MTVIPSLAVAHGPALRLDDLPATLPAALHLAAKAHPDAGVGVITGTEPDRLITYPELLDQAQRVLGGLIERGVRTGDAVLVAGADLADFFAAYWGCLLGGIRPVTVARPPGYSGPNATADKLIDAWRQLDRPLILTSDSQLAGLGQLGQHYGVGALRLASIAVCASAAPRTETVTPQPSEVALMMLSSGSTGTAKLVQLTHRGLVELAAGARQTLPGITAGDVTLNWLPLDHSGAFLLYHVTEVLLGATNWHAPVELILDQPLRWLDLLVEHQVTHSWAPNFGYRQLTEALAGAPERYWDLSGLRTLVSGGEQITWPVVREFLAATARFGVTPAVFTPCWGMAETTTAITYTSFDEVTGLHRIRSASGELRTFVSVGKPSPGASLRIVDEYDEPVTEGEIGRLQVRSARITPGYAGDADGGAALCRDGWLRTGDLGLLERGALTITGREKDLIIIAGHNHYCHEIEQVVAEVPGVLAGQVAAYAIPDPTAGTESLGICYCLADGTDESAVSAAIRRTLALRLQLTAAAVMAIPAADFPRTTSGKIQRSALATKFADRLSEHAAQPPGSRPTAGGSDVAERVMAAATDLLGLPVDRDRPLYEQGMSSVQLIRLYTRLRRELGTDFPQTAMFEHPSVAALADYLVTATPSTVAPVEPAPVAQPGLDQRIAIVGMAVRFPGADSVDQFWANLSAGVHSVRRFTSDEVAAAGLSGDLVPAAGVLSDIAGFDTDLFQLSAKEAALTDPAQRLFLECCYEALEQGGYAAPSTGRRIGVFAGSGMNLYPRHSYLQNNLVSGSGQDDPVTAMQTAIGTQPDFLATRVAYRLGLTGPALSVQTACSTSLVAVHLASQALRAGEADLALAGAAAIHVPQVTGYQHTEGSILSARGKCHAFDAEADGTVGGSGVAAVLLKPLAAALADGDTIYSVILGSAINNDGAGKAAFTAPGVAGQVRVIRDALQVAGVAADSIGYLEAHGTGTRLGDPIEVEALRRAFRMDTDRVGFCTLGSVKSNVGHLDSCAGMAGLIKAALVLRHRQYPPQINLRQVNPELALAASPFVLRTELADWPDGDRPRRAGVSALGVGGTNAHVVLEEPPPAPDRPQPAPRPVLVPVSAQSPAALDELCSRLAGELQARPGTEVADVAFTLATGRVHRRHRRAVVGTNPAELAVALRQPVDGTGVAGRLALACTGQGAAYPGMAVALAARFRVFADTIGECAPELVDVLLAEPEPGTALPTDVAQPALFAYQVALGRLWNALGVRPEVVVGHSVGHYAALCLAGGLTYADGLALTAARGQLMQRTEPGGMIAVLAEPGVAEELIAEVPGVELAGRNGERECVLAGDPASIEAVAAVAERRRIPARRLEVDRAFHSRLLDPMLDDFTRQASKVAFQPLRLAVADALDGTLLPAGWVPEAEHLRRHAREPVRYDLAVRQLMAAGCDTVIEVGPDAVLTGIGRRQFGVLRWLASQRRDSGDDRVLLAAAARLYEAGSDLNWAALVADHPGRRIPLPAYPFQRTRCWVEPKEQRSMPTTDDPAATPVPLDQILALVGDQVGLAAAKVDPDAPFVELGADSLVLVALARDVEQSLGVRVALRELFESADTPRKLAAAVHSQLPAGPSVDTPPPATVTTPPPSISQSAPLPAVSAPVVVPAASAVAVPVSGEPGAGVQELINAQLQVMNQFSQVMSQQLALMASPPAQALPASTSAPQAVPASATAPQVATAATPSTSATVPVRASTAAMPSARAAGTSKAGGCDFSVYFFGDYPQDAVGTDKYRVVLDTARFADEHGFHAVWLPERHFHSFGGLFPSPSVLAAALATHTRQIRLHAGSVVLPLHHPIRVAEEWSVIDNLSGGRVGLCVASGWHANDFALAPENFGRHKEVMLEHLEVVQALWRGESVPARSGDGKDIQVALHPRPVQAMPPLFTAVVGNPDSYRAAAERDLGVVTNLMTQTPAQLAERIAEYRARRAECGLDPDAGRVVALLHTYLGTDLAATRAAGFEPFCRYLRSSMSLFGQVTNSLGFAIDFDNTPADDLHYLLEQAYARYCESRALIGTVDSCAPIVSELLAAGVNEIACFVDFGVSADQIAASMPVVDQLRRRYFGADSASDTDKTSGTASAGQRRIWLFEQLTPGTNSYHEPKAIRLDGPLDVDALRSALTDVVRRHTALRTTFGESGGELIQTVHASVPVECPVLDCTGMAEADGVSKAMELDGRTPFDLAGGPLFRLRLLRFGPERHVLMMVVHHIVFDSLSTAVFVRDLGAYYTAALRGQAAELEPLPAATRVQRGTDPEDLRYWTATLAGDLPVLALPIDHPRPAVRAPEGGTVTHRFDARLTRAIRGFSAEARATCFMTLMAGVAATLGLFSRQSDLIIGTPVSNRPAEAADLVGFHLDTVPLRLDLTGDPTFAALVAQVRDRTLDAYAHSTVDFDELVATVNPPRDPGRTPLFSIMVEFEQESPLYFAEGIDAAASDVDARKAPFDLNLYLINGPDEIRCHLEYDATLFAESSVRRLLDYLEQVLTAATATPAHRLSQLTELTAADAARIAEWSTGGPAVVSNGVLHELFAAQARRTPDAVALRHSGTEVSYRELDDRANGLAWALTERDVGPGSIVGVQLPRGIDLIVSLLGVLKAGAAYLPLDPATIEHRRAFMVDDSGAGLVIDAPWSAEPRTDPPPVQVRGEDLAYCIYTSGSTGRPKGVLVPHRGPAGLVSWLVQSRPPLRTLAWTSVGFDISVEEIFSTLAGGGTLVLIPDELRYDPAALTELIVDERVERIFMPFTPLKYLVDALTEAGGAPALRELVSCGEPVTVTARLQAFLTKYPDCRLINEYGPTEASCIATSHLVDPAGPTSPPIGRPIPGATVRLLDAELRPVPVGVVGELHLGGVPLADGYLNRPDQNEAAFTEHPDGERWYRTGDLARWRPDGLLEFCGRVDDQVKIRGFRVEPGEVASVAAELPEVADAAVVVHHDNADEPYLAAYLVASDPGPDAHPSTDGAVSTDRVAAALAARLPDYMVPRVYQWLAELPLTTSGKLDRPALLPPGPGRSGDVPSEPADPVQRRVHELWSEQLGQTQLGVDESFFSLGGHSLMAVRLINRVRAEFGVPFPVQRFFANPTVRGMAAVIAQAASGQLEVETRSPVSFYQRRLCELASSRGRPEANNLGQRLLLDGDLDVTALRTALRGLVERHQLLRARIIESAQEPLLEVLSGVPVDLALIDLTDHPAPQRAEAARQHAETTVSTVFQHDQAPLWRAVLLRLDARQHELVLAFDHVIVDEWSQWLCLRELAELYGAAVSGRPADLAEVNVEYTDFVRWQREQVTPQRYDELREYWSARLAGVPRLALPFDRPRPEELSGDGALQRFTMEPALVSALDELCQRLGVSRFVACLTALMLTLSRASGQTDLAVGIMGLNRNRPEHEPIIGLIATSVLVRLVVSPGRTFADLAHDVAEQVYAAMDHQDFPPAAMLNEITPEVPHPDWPPRLQVLFTMLADQPDLTFPGLTTRVEDLSLPDVARTEAAIYLLPADGREGANGTNGIVEYSTDIFDPATIEALTASFLTTLTKETT